MIVYIYIRHELLGLHASQRARLKKRRRGCLCLGVVTCRARERAREREREREKDKEKEKKKDGEKEAGREGWRGQRESARADCSPMIG
jgi:hypothetical protein